ncbi:MAG: hypothetical protein L0154_14305, partial [Chloroflexi bacterium]|nr:hypothetical protein [Chloroflexota bacterium]
MNNKLHLLGFVSIVLLIASLTVPHAAPVSADHSWGNYHWARSENPLSLEVGNNLTGPWGGHLSTAVSDWNQSNVIDLTIAGGQASGKCRPTAGRIEVCNDTYGNNGWLGIAQIWASGDHITQA